MTALNDFDPLADYERQLALLEPLPAALDAYALRMRPSELARLLGVSRQAVHEWVKHKRIALGPDGRVDPRRAVLQLLTTGDPGKLRSKVFEPVSRALLQAKHSLADLLRQLDAARDDAEFHQGAADELAAQVNALRDGLQHEREALALLPGAAVVDAVLDWLEQAEASPTPPASILACAEVPPPAPMGGAGFSVDLENSDDEAP